MKEKEKRTKKKRKEIRHCKYFLNVEQEKDHDNKEKKL